jgi:hypothetical protein
MNSTAFVDHGIFIGIVCGAGANQFGDQRRLAAVTCARNQYRRAFPPDDAGVHKHPARCVLSHGQLHMRFKFVEHVFKASRTRKPDQIPITQIEPPDFAVGPTGVSG